jgi:hypothetical protein
MVMMNYVISYKFSFGFLFLFIYTFYLLPLLLLINISKPLYTLYPIWSFFETYRLCIFTKLIYIYIFENINLTLPSGYIKSRFYIPAQDWNWLISFRAKYPTNYRGPSIPASGPDYLAWMWSRRPRGEILSLLIK